MLLIPCPWCGPRDEHEFSYGGEAHIARPTDPYALSDGQWADYLFMRSNPKGMHLERWMHAHGCRRWFNVARDTVSHEIAAVYRVGEQPPRGIAPARVASAPAQKIATGTPAPASADTETDVKPAARAAVKKVVASRTQAAKTATGEATTGTATTKKTVASKTTARKTTARKTTAKKTAASRAKASKSTAKNTTAKKASASKSTTSKTAAKKRATRKPATAAGGAAADRTPPAADDVTQPNRAPVDAQAGHEPEGEK